jgi:hypothetical protein
VSAPEFRKIGLHRNANEPLSPVKILHRETTFAICNEMETNGAV